MQRICTSRTLLASTFLVLALSCGSAAAQVSSAPSAPVLAQAQPGEPQRPEERRKEQQPGQRGAQPQTQQHLRDAYQVTKLLCEVAPPAVVQNWLLGMNPYLNDEAPALHIADQPKEVLRAAKAFVAVG